MEELKQLLTLARGHNRHAESRIDLIASNAWISRFARLVMSSLLPNNYCIGLPGARLYGGCSYIDMIEREAVRMLKSLYGTAHVIVQYLSGMQANIGAYHAILKPGDTVVAAPPRHGGHYSHTLDGPLRFFSPRLVPCPFDPSRYNIDVEGLSRTFEKERPRLLICGWSEFLFPHPLAEIRALCDKHGVRLMYDMSHVAGLIAGGVFQPDAPRLADIVTSSTGKSLHAPDHGVALFNDASLREGLLQAVMPLLTSNTHPHEVAALGVALAEMESFGREYALQVVRNAQALGAALHRRGARVLFADAGFTRSHTVLVQVAAPEAAVSLLDRAGILCNACDLPEDPPGRATGLRLGAQVVTRRGMREEHMEEVAEAFCAVLLRGEDPDAVQYARVRPLAERWQRAAFSFDFHFPDSDRWADGPYAEARVDSVERLLRGLVPFANCPLEELHALAERLELLHERHERLLFRKGDPPDAVWFVVEGDVTVGDLSAGPERVVCRVGAGSHLGELGVMRGVPRSLDARVGAGARLLRISAKDFSQMLANSAPVRAYFERYVTLLEAPAPRRS